MVTRIKGHIRNNHGKRIGVDLTLDQSKITKGNLVPGLMSLTTDTLEIKVTSDSSVYVKDDLTKTEVREHIGRSDWTLWKGGTRNYRLDDGEVEIVAVLNIFPFFDRYLEVNRSRGGSERV